MNNISLNSNKTNFSFINSSEMQMDEETFLAIPELQEPLCLWLTEENFEQPLTLSLPDLVSNQKDKNDLLEKVSKNWIQDAVHHVFSDPLRSFLELVTNALDASILEHPIGKFGMGFLSIFAVLSLKETEGCKIQIATSYVREDGSIFSYTIDISREMEVTFTKIAPRSASGTKIKILPLQGKFSRETLASLKSYLYYLQFYPHGKILVETDDGQFEIGRGEKILAHVSLKESELGVHDAGCGISLEIAQTKLFIPSSSSKIPNPKEFSTIFLPELVTYQGKKHADESYFLATIKGVVVIAIPFYPKTSQDIHLPLSSSTKITLARDAVEFSNEGIFLKEVIIRTVDGLTKGRTSSEMLVAFYRGLLAWEKQTPSMKKKNLSRFFLEIVARKLDLEKTLPVPIEYPACIEIARCCGKRLIPLHRELLLKGFQSLESALLTSWKTDSELETKVADKGLIQGKALLFIDDVLLPKEDGIAKVLSLGMSNLIFAPRSLISYAQKRAAIEKCSEEKILASSVAMRYCEEGERLKPIASLNTSLFLLKETDDEFLVITSSLRITPSSFKISEALSSGEMKEWIDDSYFESLTKKYGDEQCNIFERHLMDRKIIMSCFDICRGIDFFQEEYEDPEALKMRIKEYFRSLFDDCILKIPENQLFFIKKIESDTLIDQLYEIYIKNAGETLPSLDEFKISSSAEDMLPAMGSSVSFKDAFLQFFIDNDLLIKALPHQIVRIAFEYLFFANNITSEVKVFTKQETLWPISGRPDLIEKLFFELFERYGTLVSALVQRTNSFSLPPQKKPIHSVYLTQFNRKTCEQLEMFQSLETYLHVPLKSFLLPAVAVNQLLQNSEISQELKEKTEEFTDSLLLLCREALTFSDGEIPFIYGDKSTPIIINPKEDSTFNLDKLYIVLLSLKDHPSLYEKLLRLTLEELQQLFNKNKILEKIQERKIFSLSSNIFLNTILFNFVNRFSCTPFPCLCALLENASSFEEVCILMTMTKFREFSSFFSDQKNFRYLPEILNTYLREKISEQTLKQIYAEQRDRESRVRLWSRKNFAPIADTILEFIEKIEKDKKHFVTRAVFLDESLQKLFEPAPFFTIRQILAALHTQPLLKNIAEGDDKAFVESVTSCKGKTELQIVNQSVENGNDSPGPISAAVECLQNSLDARADFDAKKYPESWSLRHQLLGSSDAVSKQLSTISYSIEMLENGAASQMILVIKDGVGMASLKTLFLDFLIPGYSEKGERENQIGKIGNGSFQIYKDAEMVLLKTRLLEDPSKVYLLKIFPIRNDRKEVIDLSVRYIDISDACRNEPFFGVEFQILFSNQKKEIHFEASSLRDWIRENIGKTYLENDKIRLVLKTLDGQEELLQGLKVDGIKIESTSKTRFVFVQTKNPDDESLVLTSGIYLKTLSVFLQEMGLLPAEIAEKFSQGWCLILPPKSYLPLQSRRKVQMEESLRKELKIFVAEWLCLRTLLDESSGPGKQYYPHFASSAPLSQVYPETKGAPKTQEPLIDGIRMTDLTTFFVNYPIERFGSKSFIDWVRKGYDQLVKSLKTRKIKSLKELEHLPKDHLAKRYASAVEGYRKSCMKDFQNWKKRILKKAKGDLIFESYLKEVIFKWFEKKVEKFSRDLPSISHLKNQHKDLKTPDEIQRDEKNVVSIDNELKKIPLKPAEIRGICEEMLTLYCRLFDAGKSPPTVRLIYDPSAKTKGCYLKSSHCISIDTSCIKPSQILELALVLALRETPSLEFEGSQLILITLAEAGVLNHELEHARRRSDCRKNRHEDAEDVYGKKMHFEGCAKGATRKALRGGLWDKWCDQMYEILQKRGITAQSLEEWISIFRKIESDPSSFKILCDLLLS